VYGAIPPLELVVKLIVAPCSRYFGVTVKFPERFGRALVTVKVLCIVTPLFAASETVSVTT
jgi:hypothetical protein